MKIIQQGKYECGAAALAMLLDESLFDVKRAMGKAGWRNDDSGCERAHLRAAARAFGKDLIGVGTRYLDFADFSADLSDAVLTVKSLNYLGKRAHAVAWKCRSLLDPNTGIDGRKSYPKSSTIDVVQPYYAELLAKRLLTDNERRRVEVFYRLRQYERVREEIQELI